MRFTIAFFFILGLQVCFSCEQHERGTGCRIHNRRCSCDDFGCKKDYPYETYEACHSALKGKRSNGCYPNPCMHEGSCIQISQAPGFKCRCEGTGFFGARCSRACPKGGAGRYDIFPYECIVI
ncbi:PREDICTED: cell death abnormality protein 1-like [Nicrophorus vespilloides]|uniref:Cell death abnormality protein 1-like n=1 Tax=Nicrophorus vespilloides TaxID=110193 RepID=A0ABM1N2Q1_NICVS|nr:PREDICTED: cell death abnormality protein 1-like [Nicrophorus vespilloides]